MPILERLKKLFRSSFFIPFLLSFMLWCIAFRGFLSEHLALVEDAISYVNQTKYLTDAFLKGIIPVWNSASFGMPNEFFLLRLGAFNPLYLLIALLRLLGLPFIFAYTWTLAGYYFLGCYGFYALGKRLTGDRLASFAGFLMLYFSALGTRLFDSFILLVFVPLSWFFFFLVDFFHAPSRKNFLGMIFSAMILFSTYVPFYFIVIVFSMLMLFVIVFPDRLFSLWKTMAGFAFRRRVVVTLGILALLVSLMPGILFFQASRTGKYVMPRRQHGSSSQMAVQVNADTPKEWAISEDIAYSSYFSDFRKMKFAVLYVPMFFWILLCCGIFTRYSRRMLYYLSVIIFFMMLGIPEFFPVYDFMRAHVFFFRYFRNLHFFLWWVILPVGILMVLEQFKQILDAKKTAGYFLVVIIIVHILWFVFLIQQADVVASSILTVFFSAVFFIAFWYVKERGDGRRILLANALLLVIVCQPMEVYGYLNRNVLSEDNPDQYTRIDEKFYFSRHRDLKKDPSGKLKLAFHIATADMQALASHIDWRVFDKYINSMFYIYDRIEVINGAVSWPRVEQVLNNGENIVFLDTWKNKPLPAMQKKALRILGPGQGVRVIKFWPNGIILQTNFSEPKFLVYTDGYYVGWKATLDKKPWRIYRAQRAFKGFYIPAGKHQLVLKFEKHLFLRFGIWVAFIIVFVFIMRLLWDEVKRHD